jgi:integrase
MSWTPKTVVRSEIEHDSNLYATCRQELWTPLNPSVSTARETYFGERKGQGGHLADPADRFIAQEFRKQGMPKIAALYRAWKREGDMALWKSSSTIRTIHLMLGHADIKQTQRYLNITDEELRKAMTGVWERRRQLKAVSQ